MTPSIVTGRLPTQPSARCASCPRWSPRREIRASTAGAKNLGKAAAHLGMLEPEVERRFEVAQLVAAVVAMSLEAIRQHPLLLHQAGDAVRELDLAAGTRRHGAQVVKQARRENVAADD